MDPRLADFASGGIAVAQFEPQPAGDLHKWLSICTIAIGTRSRA
jgi:hypothetical protein